MKNLLVALVLLGLYAIVILPLSDHLTERPVAVKLGYTPTAQILKVAAGDHRYTLAEFIVLKVLFYYGTLLQHWEGDRVVPAEYYNMYKTLETAVQLDPYNTDAYYFAQSAFTWDVGHAGDVNRMLKYGMQHRYWDWSLPFFVGFNSAYFLQDYSTAAEYMQKAAEISGNPLFTNLAARFFYEAGQNELGIFFLEGMVKQTKDPGIRRLYQLRLQALRAIRKIETALQVYQDRFGRLPQQLQALVEVGLLDGLPDDPYGGRFYLDSGGAVRSTSKLAGPKGQEPLEKETAP